MRLDADESGTTAAIVTGAGRTTTVTSVVVDASPFLTTTGIWRTPEKVFDGVTVTRVPSTSILRMPAGSAAGARVTVAESGRPPSVVDVDLPAVVRPEAGVATTSGAAGAGSCAGAAGAGDAGAGAGVGAGAGATGTAVTENVRVTVAAAAVAESPAWSASIVHVPVARSVTDEPMTVHTEGVELVYVTVRPLEAVAVNVTGPASTCVSAGTGKVIVCAAGDDGAGGAGTAVTAKLLLTVEAAAVDALPAWSAAIVHVPTATSVTVVPPTVQTPVVELV
jgi:hypothetical protein